MPARHDAARHLRAALHPPGTSRTHLAELREAWPGSTLVHDQRATGAAVRRIFGAARRSDDLEDDVALVVRGTPFQIKVWEALLRIPAGHVVSYHGLARRIGRATASRAVGSAVGQNPVAYLIPCHRVIHSTGAIGEYRWGSVRKQALLGWEAARQESRRRSVTPAQF